MDQLHSAENAGAGVPAGIRLHAWIDGYRHIIFSSKINVRCDVDGERNVSVVL